MARLRLRKAHPANVLISHFFTALMLIVAVAWPLDAFSARLPRFMEASFKGDLARVQRLLDKGADVNMRSAGTTPLMLSASKGHEAVVRELLSRGALVNSKNKQGWTALMMATQGRHDRVIRLLLARGANPKIGTGGKNALTIAQKVGRAGLFSKATSTASAEAQTQKEAQRLAQAQREAGRLAEARKKEQRLAEARKEERRLTNARRLAEARKERLRLAEVKEKEAQRRREEQEKQQQNEPTREDKIAELLRRATQQRRANRLTQPRGNNAYASYRSVLRLDPKNALAQAGIQSIAAKYKQAAYASKEKGAWKESLAKIKKGLTIAPKHSGLLALRKEVQGLQRAQTQISTQAQAQQKITQLLTQATRQFRAKQWLEPKKNNAFASYQAVLRLDPKNAKAQAGITALADAYYQLAKQQQSNGKPRSGLASIAKGKKARPQHAGLLALQKELQAQRAEQAEQAQQQAVAQRLQDKVAGLLARAEQQIKANRLTSPRANNAYASYLEVLTLQADHPQAQDGILRIATAYQRLATRAKAQGALDKSIGYLEKGLQIAPRHTGLVQLQTEIKALQTSQSALAAQKADEAQRQQQITRLLANAARRLKAKRFMEPKEDSAYYYFQAVLALQPGHPKAQAGLQTIAAKYQQLAAKAKKRGTLQKSLDYIEKGLQAVPQQAELLSLRQAILTLQAQKSEKARQQAQKEQLQQQVVALLAKARGQFEAGQLLAPQGSNAHESYQAVLQLEPENQQASQGIAQIVREFQRKAQQAQQKNDLAQSMAYIQSGLQLASDDANLHVLATKVQALQNQAAKAQRQQRIGELLAQAERQMSAQKWQHPPADNAYTSYREVLTLAPAHSSALAGMARIADELLRLAEQAASQEQLTASFDYIKKGLEIIPDHAALLLLQRRLMAQQAKEKVRRIKVEALLTEARQQAKAGKLVEPAGDNAYHSYLQVFELAPSNKAATIGLQGLVKQAEQNAKVSLTKLRRLEDHLTAARSVLRSRLHTTLSQQASPTQRATTP